MMSRLFRHEDTTKKKKKKKNKEFIYYVKTNVKKKCNRLWTTLNQTKIHNIVNDYYQEISSSRTRENNP